MSIYIKQFECDFINNTVLIISLVGLSICDYQQDPNMCRGDEIRRKNLIAFYSILMKKNKSEKYYIKSAIRLVKYWNSLNGNIYSNYGLEKYIINQRYWSDNSLKDYFYTSVSFLVTNNLSVSDNIKVNRFKELIQNIRNDEIMWGDRSQYIIERLLPKI